MSGETHTSGIMLDTKPLAFSWLRSAIEYLSILAVGLVLLAVLERSSAGSFDRALTSYRALSQQRAYETADAVSSSLAQIYQNLRTISMLPSVIKIDRHGDNLSEDAHLAIQQIYNNLMNNVAASEVYIVPDGFNPDAMDTVTGKSEEPILMFDEQITFFSKDASAGEGEEQTDQSRIATEPEVEIYEYRQLQQHVAWLKQNYPTVRSFMNMQQPVISGPEIITCDNSEFNASKLDADRMGVMFSVPFYGPDGNFKGTVTAIIRTKALQKLLPNSDYALTNPAHNFVAVSVKDGQQTESSSWVKLGQADPSLLFSAAVPISLKDPASKWVLWAGSPNAAYFESGEVQAIQDNRVYGWSLCFALVCLLTGSWNMIKRRRQAERVRHQSEQLEKVQKLNAAEAAVTGLGGALTVKKHELEEKQDQIAAGNKRVAEQQAAIIASLGQGLSRLARGDLTVQLQREANDPFNQIKDDFSKAVEKLRTIASVTAIAAEHVTGGADQILTSVAHLAERTEDQSSSLMETAASMEEMSATVRQNAGNAQQAKLAAMTVRDMSVNGSKIAQDAVVAVRDIDGTSQQISAIVGFIEEIAFQTNILALNAAVEAARAGDAGSGFAVIAGEVRALSKRSSVALQDIKGVIAVADARVSSGVKLVAMAGAALNDISASAVKVADLMSDIAGATMEQATSIDQVTRAVSEMDSITQQNAALADQATQALRASQAHIAKLRQAVSFFRTSAAASQESAQPGAFMRGQRRVAG